MTDSSVRKFSTKTVKYERTSTQRAEDIVQIPNGGYGWVVVAASFFVHVFVLGNVYSFGIFFSEYIDAFSAPQGQVSWIGSIGAALMTGLAVYTGAWADQFGNNRMILIGGAFIGTGYLLASYSTELWHLFLTQGLVAGVGYSFAFVPGVSVVGQWFTTRRAFAVGIAVAGSGLGQFAISQVTGVLIQSFGWRTALRYLALINFVGLTICSLFIYRTIPCYKQQRHESNWQFFYDRNFSLLYFGTFIATLGMFMPFTHIPRYAKEEGLTESQAVFLLSVMGITSAVGRITLGLFADYLIGKVMALRISMVCGGIATLCWIACTTNSSLLAYAAVYGYFAGGLISLIPAVCAHLFGIEKLGRVLGVIYNASFLGNLFSAPVGGFLFDSFGYYTPSIAVSGGLMILGFGVTLFVTETPSKRGIFAHSEAPTEQSEHKQHTVDVDSEAGSQTAAEDAKEYADVENLSIAPEAAASTPAADPVVHSEDHIDCAENKSGTVV